MRSNTLFKLSFISIASALMIGLLGAWLVRTVSGPSYQKYTRAEFLLVTRLVESAPYPEGIKKYTDLHSDSPDTEALLWVVSPDGKILGTNSPDPSLPIQWETAPIPREVHEITYSFRPYRMFPDAAITRLAGPTLSYLIVQRIAGGLRKQIIEITLTFFFVTVALATFFTLFGTFFYLRFKSAEAQDVLSRLGQGDLKARFKIRQFDEVGNLMLDFNKMADEIERLVGRIRKNDEERGRLVAELSHDLRTPLASLRTSIDALTEHFDDVPDAQRREFLKMIQAEIGYFTCLMDDLSFVARLGDSSYRAAAESFDVSELLRAEVDLQRTHEQGRKRGLNWTFEPTNSDSVHITGDPFLVRRLFRNAFDNAGRYARAQVAANVFQKNGTVFVEIRDDGPGMSSEQLQSFGTPKRHRLMSEGRPSSGLGSVIMKRIVDLHQGELEIRNAGEKGGTLLSFRFHQTALAKRTAKFPA